MIFEQVSVYLGETICEGLGFDLIWLFVLYMIDLFICLFVVIRPMARQFLGLPDIPIVTSRTRGVILHLYVAVLKPHTNSALGPSL